jgi:hypothetical protein
MMPCEMDEDLFRLLNEEFGKQLAGVRIHVEKVKLKMGNEISAVKFDKVKDVHGLATGRNTTDHFEDVREQTTRYLT